MRVLVDANIILDALLLREPFFVDATLLNAIESKQVQGYITATALGLPTLSRFNILCISNWVNK